MICSIPIPINCLMLTSVVKPRRLKNLLGQTSVILGFVTMHNMIFKSVGSPEKRLNVSL